MMNTLEELQPFCEETGERKNLALPFTRPDGFTYASDGRIVVRVAALPGAADDGPAAEGLFLKAKRYEVCQIPELPPVENERSICTFCEGKGCGPVKMKCHACNGTGEDACFHCGHTMECERCRGDGEMTLKDPNSTAPCCECDGKGWTSKANSVEIGGLHYDTRLLRKIVGLPGLVFRNAFGDNDQYLHPPAWFTFDGGEGLLMPRSRAADENG